MKATKSKKFNIHKQTTNITTTSKHKNKNCSKLLVKIVIEQFATADVCI